MTLLSLQCEAYFWVSMALRMSCRLYLTREYVTEALKAAMNAADLANAKARETLASLDDPALRKAIVDEVRHEVADISDWMGEVADLLVTQNEDAA